MLDRNCYETFHLDFYYDKANLRNSQEPYDYCQTLVKYFVTDFKHIRVVLSN